jgi:hypothetical protein
MQVILDSDVADLYGVETRDVNKAVKNNPDKFPDGYIIELDTYELEDLRWKFSTAKFTKTRVPPKAFTEKGLYMLATILKSPQATQTTIAIIETFAKIKALSGTIKELTTVQDKKEQHTLMQKVDRLSPKYLTMIWSQTNAKQELQGTMNIDEGLLRTSNLGPDNMILDPRISILIHGTWTLN